MSRVRGDYFTTEISQSGVVISQLKCLSQGWFFHRFSQYWDLGPPFGDPVREQRSITSGLKLEWKAGHFLSFGQFWDMNNHLRRHCMAHSHGHRQHRRECGCPSVPVLALPRPQALHELCSQGKPPDASEKVV